MVIKSQIFVKFLIEHNVLDAFCQNFNNIGMHGNLNRLGIKRSIWMNAMISYQFSLSPAYFWKHNHRTFWPNFYK